MVKIPKINLNSINIDSGYYFRACSEYELSMDIVPVENKLIEIEDLTPPKEMTLEEVERELGYKVKIKSNEGEV